MIQTTVEVGGMACSMCEAHINDAVRSAFPVDKVSSSHAKGKTVIAHANTLVGPSVNTVVIGVRMKLE